MSITFEDMTEKASSDGSHVDGIGLTVSHEAGTLSSIIQVWGDLEHGRPTLMQSSGVGRKMP